MKKGKEKQMIASSKTLILQVKESGRKVDETEVDFNQLPRQFYLETDIFNTKVLSDNHGSALKKVKKLRDVNVFITKHL